MTAREALLLTVPLLMFFSLRGMLLESKELDFGSERRGVRNDFNGDSLTDVFVFDKTSGWTVAFAERSQNKIRFPTSKVFPPTKSGLPLAGDFNGDGLSDRAIFDPSSKSTRDPNNWSIEFTENPSRGSAREEKFSFSWGLPDSLPLACDFNGDGRDDPAVFEPTSGNWSVVFMNEEMNFAKAVLGLPTEGIRMQWGLPGDIPLPTDFTGDGICELVVVRASADAKSYEWFVFDTTSKRSWQYLFGEPGQRLATADTDGDGKSESWAYSSPLAGGPGMWRGLGQNDKFFALSLCEASQLSLLGAFGWQTGDDFICLPQRLPLQSGSGAGIQGEYEVREFRAFE